MNGGFVDQIFVNLKQQLLTWVNAVEVFDLWVGLRDAARCCYAAVHYLGKL